MVGFYCVSWTNGPVSTSKKESVAGDTIADVLDCKYISYMLFVMLV